MSTNHRSPAAAAAARKRPLPDEKNEPNKNSLNDNKHTASNDTTTTTTAIHRSKRVNISPSLPTPTQNHTDIYDCNAGDDNDDDDDDEVEFLLCIDPPPDVSTQVQEVTTSSQQEENNKEVMASISPITPSSSLSLKSSSLKPPSPLLLSLLPISAFPLSSSAYFQSLAEICYAILWDARWRVQEVDGESDHRHHHQHQHRRLFTWEQGDDLSVIHTLSRRYVEPPDHRRKQSNNNNNDNDDDTNSHDNDTSNELNQKEQKVLNEEEENNNDHDRCLEMYTRLYFRKGPWFRLDNIYTSYYLPKKNENQEERNLAEELQQQQQQQPTSSAKPSTELSCEEEKSSAPIIKKPATSPSKFFLPTARKNNSSSRSSSNNNRSGITNTHNNNNSSHGDDYIDQEYLDLQMEAVKVFLGDIKQLFQMGFIRSFQNEEECGKIVGKRKEKYDYTAASLLRQDEQRTVFAKLGGCGRKKTQTKTNRQSTTTRGYGDGINNRSASSSTLLAESSSENLIWKQMCQQQTIFYSFNNTNNRNIPTDCDPSISKTQNNNNNVLPVIKHVHRILVEKWASAIVLKASKVEYVPLGILRSATQRICDVLFELTSGRNNTIITSNSSNDIITSIMCLRLRENPLKVLHRASRLYLCATSGPGDMRNDGTNAWRSLPNAHTKDLQKIPLRTNCVSPPGGSWSTMSYPGKDWRMRIKSFQFIRAYKPIILDEFSTDAADTHTSKCDDIQVFSNVQSFHQWELGVGIRENCDFLLETNDLLLYNERKRAREGNPDEVNNNGSLSGNIDDASSEDDSTFIEETIVDFFDLLTIVGRSKIIEGILAIKKEECKNMISEIERDVSTLLGTPFGDRPLSTLVGISSIDATSSRCVEESSLKNECERILGVIGIILIHVLEFRNIVMHETDVTQLASRPWLRHMNWEGCISYILWDVIPILERRGYYHFAINALEVLLFGRRLERTATNQSIPDSFVPSTEHFSLISRRARGKALDRLVIDYTHCVRKSDATGVAVLKTTQKGSKKAKSTEAKKKMSPKSTASEVVARLIKPLLIASVGRGQITFSAIRTLARRLKCPLSHTLQGLEIYEVNELGHRLGSGEEQQDMTKYIDWQPITDTTVANALNTETNTVGGRCSFIGFEEDDQTNHIGSLNVEELAKEYYYQGRLPAIDSSPIKGGWIGYHDEGGKIRTLFRILSSEPLGMDWEFNANSDVCSREVHLSPYQGAPFDLHVGAEHMDSTVRKNKSTSVGSGGIYKRRKSSIDAFLSKLSNLDGENLSNFVYDSINNRVQYVNSSHRPDLTLENDVQHTRTLSMLAVGFGGKMLASIFRCFFFDYRHYSGGLPDLLLVRALYEKSTTADDEHIEELVDLGEWVGETFSEKYQDAVKAKQAWQLLGGDTDDDFLGCSKVGDSGGRNTFKRPSRARNSFGPKNENEGDKVDVSMPDRLSLSHNSRSIKVECMFVEVKSHSDRLDSRQEDWLNILDLHGNSRVCKFEKAPKHNKNAKKKSKS